MENKPEIKKPEEKKSKSKIVLVVLLILLLLSNGAFIYLWLNESGRAYTEVIYKEKVIVENNTLTSDLQKLKTEYATLETNDLALQKELEEKRAQIDELIAQAEKHKGDAYIISKLRKETETLRSIMKHFVVQIDSLNTANQTLVAEKKEVTASLDAEKNKSTQLTQEKEKLQSTVNLGSKLKAAGTKAIGVKFKSGGKKEIETNRASRVERIKVSFTLGENRIAKKETKPVYVRIVSPEGKEITKSTEEENLVTFNGSKGYFAAKQDVNYRNEEVAVDVICPSPTGFVPGKYLITIVCDDVVVGETDVTLK